MLQRIITKNRKETVKKYKQKCSFERQISARQVLKTQNKKNDEKNDSEIERERERNIDRQTDRRTV